MSINAKVANHSGLGLQDTVLEQVTEVRLNEASDVSLDISPQDIASLSRSGDDLVLMLQNGEVITLDGFYIDPQEQSHLYLEGDEFAGDIFRIDMASTSPGNIPYEAIPVENTIESAVLGAPFSAAGTTLAALGVIGATGLMLGGVNSGGGNDEESNTSDSPDAPIISSVADNVEPSTGELESGSDINDTTPTLTGTAGADSSVAIYDGDTLLDTVDADGKGDWSLELTAPLTEGEHSLTAVATDPEGNISDASDAFIIIIDTLPPAAPELENSDGTTLTGTGEPGSAITVTNSDGDVVGETAVGDDGNFTLGLFPEQEDGTELTATATDGAGNESESSAPVTVDAAAPEAPLITAVNDNAEPVTGELNSGDSSNDQTPTLLGTAEAGSSIAVYDDDTLLKTVEADTAGNWSLELSEPLAEGEHHLSAVATDASGNVSDPSDAFVITIDITVPEPPILKPTDGTTLTGTGEPGVTVDITDGDGNIVDSVEVDEDGNFEITLDPALEDGTELTATATDPAGNASGPSNPVTVDSNTDTTPPAEGENSIAFGDGGDGFLNADEIGNVTLTGTIEDGLDSGNVQLVITDGEGGSVTVDPADITVDGTTLTVAGQDLSGLAEGELTATLTVTDDAGNAADFTADSLKDTTAPEAPVLEETDGVTLTGTGEPGVTVDITDGDGNIVDSVEVDEDGNFEITLDPALEDGTELTATATDPAGNASGPSNPVTVDSNTDTTPPAEGENSITFGDGGDGFLNADEIGNVTLTGTIEDGLDSGNVQLVITDGEGGSVTVDPADITVDGTTLTVAGQDLSGLAEGELTATLTVTDDAGNAADFTADSVKDTTAPEAPVLEETDGTTLAGTGEPGATVDITDGDGNIVDSVEVDEDGNFEITLDPALEDGTELTATATDPAGNASGPSNPVTVDSNTDTTPPAEGENSIAFGDGGDGFLNADEIGNVTLTGTIEDGLDSSNVQLVITDGEGGSVTVAPSDITVDGTTLTVAGQDLSGLAEGELTATLTVTDDAGNAADFTADSVKDTTAPEAPVLEETDGVTLTGTGEPGATVDITDGDGNIIDSVEVDEDGNFEITLDPALEDGTELTATATDPAGNASGPSNPVTVDSNTDTTPPAEGENSIAFGNGGDGFLNADEIGNVTLTGTIEDGLDSSNVQLVITDGEGGSVTVDPADITVDGTTLTVAGQDLSGLAEDELTATLTVTDDAGNAADFTADSVKDTTAPEAPVLEETDGVTLTGTGEPGATVDITDSNGNPIATTEVEEDGTFSVDLDPMPEDGTELTATATDPAGNASGPSNPVTVDSNTDTTPPAEGENSIAFGNGGDGFLNADEIGNVTLTGTIEDGLDSSNVQLVITDGEGGSVTVDPADITVDGTTLTVAGQDLSGLAEGELTATLTVTDDAGNAADFTADSVKDTTAPEAPVLEETDGVTLTGTGEPGATVDITDSNGNPIATTEVEEDGTFSVDLDPMPEDGTELTATATDPAGNASGPSNPVTVDSNTDTTPPAEGENSIAFGDGGDGFLNADEIGNVTLTGTIEDGLDSGNVQLVITDGEGGSVTVDPADITVDGTTLTVAGQDLSGLAEGELTATLTVTDDAGNAADFTADSLKDTTAPEAPVLEETDGVTLTGTGEPGVTVDITDGDGNIVDSVEVDEDGNFEITLDPALEDGTELTATATDPAGNASGPSNPVTVDSNTDTTPPAEGENSIAFGDGGDGFLNADEIGNVTLTGTIEDGLDSGNVQLVITDGEGGSVTVDPADITVDGTTLTVAGQDLSGLAEGELTATLTVTDDAGNAADFTADSVKDTTAPEAPVLEETDGVTLTGTGEPGATVDITDSNGNPIATTEVEEDGTFSVDLDPMPEDGTELTATATDPAGNASGPSNPVTVDSNTDTTPPAEGENSIAFGDGGDGFLNADEIGNVTLTGTIEDGLDSGNVQLVITDGEGGSVTVDPADITVDGTTLTVAGQDLSGLAEGELTATLTVTDDAGNAADFTADSLKDTTAPEAPVLEETDGVTLTGTGEPGVTVDITDGDGNIVDSVEVDEDGNFEITLDPALEDGTELTATATDPAGNASGPSNPVTVDSNTDTTPPAEGENSIAFGDGGDGFLNADEIGNVTLTGTIEDGLDSGNVQLVITDGEGGSVTVDPADITVDGTTLTVAGQDLSGLAEGELTATLTVTDDAGNAADFTADSVKDTTAPEAPVLEETDGVTLTGTGEPGATVDITDSNGNPIATTEVEEDGTFSVDLDPMPEDGTELTATATDPAGNASGPSNPVTVDSNTDTTPPAEGENSIAFGDGGDGFLNADEIGNVTLTGTIEDGLDSGNVQLVITDGEGGSVTVDPADITVDGTTLTVAGQDLSGLAEGELTATLTVTDDAGNAADFTADSVKDTTAPEAPVLEETDGVTLTGTGEPGATVDITDGDGNIIDSVEVDEDGNFEITLDPALEDGTELTATATDPAGNASGPSNPVTVDSNTDTTPPAEGDNSIAFGDGFLNADEIGNVTLTGTIEDGLGSSNVQLVITDGEGGSVTVDPADITVDGTTLTVAGQDLSGLAEGELTATLTVTDDAGNAAQFDDVATKDTIAPGAPVLEATDGSELIGTGEPNTTVTITDGSGNVIGSADVDEEGNFTTPLNPVQEDGADLTATATDNAGNTSGPATITVDATSPGGEDGTDAPILTIDEAADGVTAAELADGLQTSVTLTTGTEEGDTVTVTLDDGNGGTITGEATVTTQDITNGSIAVGVTDAIADGSYTATAVITDALGNSSAESNTVDVNVDATSPGGEDGTDAPILTIDEAADGVTAAELADGLQTSVTLTIGTEEGDTVTVTLDDGNGDTITGEATVTAQDITNSSIAVGVTDAIADGSYTATAVITDALGNSSAESNTVDVNVDATSPGGEDGTDAPILTIDEAADGVTAAELADGLQTSVTLTTGTEEGDTVTVTLDDGNGGTITGEATVTAQDITNGSIAVGVTDAIADGSYTATAVITDALGNSSAESNTVDVNVDATSPGGEDGTDAPILTIDEAADGVTAAELADGLQTSVTLTTGTEEGDTVTVTLDDGNGGTITGEATVTAQDITNGSIAVGVTDAIADGSYTATAVITNALGNSSAESNTVDVNVDATSPGGEDGTDAPILTIDEAADGVTAAELADGLQTSVTLTTGTEEGDTVTVTLDDGNGGTITGEATVTAQDITNGSIAVGVTDAIADGSYTATAVITDALGNSSAESNTVDVNVDATSPGGEDGTDAPILTIDEAADGVTAAELADGLQTSVTLTIGTEEGDTVTVTLDDGNGGTITGEATVTAQDITNSSIAVGVTDAIADGSYTATAVITDALGNSSAESNTVDVNVDATSPGGEDGTDAPILTIDEAADGVTAAELADGLQTSVTLTTGTEEGDTVTVTLDDGNGGTITGEATVTAQDITNGSIAVGVTDAIADGSYTATAVITDALGNSSAESNTVDVNVDATSPTTTISIDAISEDTGTTGDFITNDDDGLTVTATLSAELATGEVLLYSTDGTTWVDITNSVTGTAVSYADAELTASATVQIKVQDAAGNDGDTESQDVVIDTTAPTGSVINFTDADGDINAAEVTDVTFEGTVEAGLTSSNLTIVITDTDNGSVSVPTENITVSAAGEVTVAGVDLTGLAEGLLTVTMTVTDDAGNENVAAVTDTATKLSDDFLDLGNANRLTISEALIASAAGAVASTQTFADTSGEATLSLSSTESLTSNGQVLDWVVTDEGRTLTLASDVDNAAATAVMVVSVTEDGSEVVYSAELLGNIDQANAESSTVDVLVTLSDGSSSTSSTLNIDITDDVPTIAASTVVESLSSNTDYTGSIFDGEDDFGFGADAANGQVQSFTFKGLTFTVSDDGTYADVTGTSTEIGLEAGDTVSIVDGVLAVETLSGESFSLNIDSGDYSYSHQGQFSATEDANTRPVVLANETSDVLGIVGLNALDIIDLTNDQLFNAYDSEENITSVQLSTIGLVSIIEALPGVGTLVNSLVGALSWSWSEDLANELGLSVVETTDAGGDKSLTITSLAGGEISNLTINEILSTVEFTLTPPGGLIGGLINTLVTGLGLDSILTSILSSTSITATDSLGATSTPDTDATVVNLDLLASGYDPAVQEGDGGDDTLNAASTGESLYGYGGNDELNGGASSDILRGGSGNDELNGGGATDLLIGGEDDDTLNGGDGVDILRWESGDEGTVAAAATDTVLNFNNGGVGSGDILDLRDMLNGAYYVDSTTNNLASYISAEYVSATGTTVLYINTEGGLAADPAASANQVINIDGLDLTDGGTLTSSEVIDSLISGEQLLVDTEVNESDVSVTVVDGDGDTATGEVTFVGEESLDTVTNTAPIVTLQGSELLGLVGLEALDLIDLSNNKVFVADPDNNLREVVINYAAVVDVSALSGLLTDPEFTWNDELATSLGLSVSTSSGGLIGTVLTTAELTITAIDGGDIDNLALNQFLATIGFDDGGASSLSLVDVDLLDAYSITATDAYDASTTDAISSLAGVNLLDSNDPLFSGVNDENTFIGEQLIDDSIDISENLEGSSIFGLSGNDSLIGGLGNDVIRGGEGNDSLVGNAGNDLLIGGSGSNTFDGGAGDDLIVTSSLDFTIEGGADIDTVSFDGTGKGIDLVALSAQAEPSVMTNIEVLDISASSETGTSLKIDADTVLNLTDGDNELYIDGDEGDSVEAAGATSSATTTEFNGTTYDTYQLGEATLYIDQDVTVNTSNG